MSEVIVTLTASQDEALTALATPLALTATETLQGIVDAQLHITEQAIATATDVLRIAKGLPPP